MGHSSVQLPSQRSTNSCKGNILTLSIASGHTLAQYVGLTGCGTQNSSNYSMCKKFGQYHS